MNLSINTRSLRILNNLLILVILVILIRTAWVNDDAYITIRSVDNFVNGNGLVYNLGERVQSFTHPLWLFIVSIPYFISRHAYYSLLFVSILASMAAILVLRKRIVQNELAVLFGLLATIFSKAFIDYSTSGLENPLSHLLLVLFLVNFLEAENSPRKLFRLSLITALAGLNRIDLLVIYFPAIVIALKDTWSAHQSDWKKMLLNLFGGFSPLILWFIFSILYYGFPFPNTAYAKIGAGIPKRILLGQGVQYFINLLNMDTLTLLIILSGLAVAILAKKQKMTVIAIGILLYMGYILYIGGDFMSGRFFTAPFLAALILIMYSERISDFRSLLIPLTIVVTMGLVSPYPSIFSTAEYGQNRDDLFDKHQIADERGVYYPGSGLLQVFPEGDLSTYEWEVQGIILEDADPPIAFLGSLGFIGYFAGPEMWCVDAYALVDPLLARLPAEYEGYWRIGHFRRDFPSGYQETLMSQENRITDPDLHKFYDQLLLITRGPIFDPQRLETIWKMNTGQFDYLLP
jgi:arabinofuranosyltransferase